MRAFVEGRALGPSLGRIGARHDARGSEEEVRRASAETRGRRVEEPVAQRERLVFFYRELARDAVGPDRHEAVRRIPRDAPERRRRERRVAARRRAVDEPEPAVRVDEIDRRRRVERLGAGDHADERRVSGLRAQRMFGELRAVEEKPPRRAAEPGHDDHVARRDFARRRLLAHERTAPPEPAEDGRDRAQRARRDAGRPDAFAQAAEVAARAVARSAARHQLRPPRRPRLRGDAPRVALALGLERPAVAHARGEAAVEDRADRQQRVRRGHVDRSRALVVVARRLQRAVELRGLAVARLELGLLGDFLLVVLAAADAHVAEDAVVEAAAEEDAVAGGRRGEDRRAHARRERPEPRAD
mmetsp:Transcript_11261/g.34613  ORF Transcript_11261/g.34613 Transcript_11261/m.34613 type:complete len:358 (+) Transcript_11261:819-1892(+)